jgi:superfamily II DNA or RNA helicase
MNQIILGNITSKLIFDDRRAYNAAYEALKYEVPGWRFTPLGKTGTWDGTASLFGRTNSTFPTGLAHLVEEALLKKGCEVITRDERDRSRMLPLACGHEVERVLEGVTLRDYQVAAIQDILRNRNAIIHAVTGAGKTKLAAGFIKLALAKGLRVLFLTNKQSLLYQTANVFRGVGMPATTIGDGEKDFSNLSVGMVQSLYTGLPREVGKLRIPHPGKPEIISYLKGVDVLILDEAHIGSADSIQAVCNAASNAVYRIGLTATPLMKGWIDDLKLMAVTGPIITCITMKDLIARGLLAQPYIKFVKVEKPVLSQRLPYGKAYKAGISENDYRNLLIVNEINALTDKGMSVLCLVTKIEHGKRLLDMLTVRSHSVPAPRFIYGAKDKETRESAVAALQHRLIDVLISSTITDEGVDIPAVNAVILAGGGEAKPSPARNFDGVRTSEPAARQVALSGTTVLADTQLDFFTLSTGPHHRHEALQGRVALGAEHSHQPRLMLFELLADFTHGPRGIDVLADHQSPGGNFSPEDHIERFGDKATAKFGVLFSSGNHQFFEFP